MRFCLGLPPLVPYFHASMRADVLPVLHVPVNLQAAVVLFLTQPVGAPHLIFISSRAYFCTA